MATKLRLVFSITIAFLSFYGSAQSNYWQRETAQKNVEEKSSKYLSVKHTLIFSFEEDIFKKELKALTAAKKNSRVVYFPDEEGELVPFRVSESPVLSPELSLKHPLIKSYVGYGLKNRLQRIRFSVSHKGIQSMIVRPGGKGNVFMQKVKKNKYAVYTRNQDMAVDMDFICKTESFVQKSRGATTLKPVDGQVLRKFRLAVSASGEYTEHHGGTVADALAGINATITRVNEVFETDLGVTLELVANTDQLLFTDAETDPYSGNLNTQVQNTLTATIGAENYDIGHLFHKGENGGNAGFVGAVCEDNKKGSAYSSGNIPEGDIFDLDFVAHEMGHQLGANHTWSFESEGTQVQAEPGSGTTIMGYAGITGVNDVAPNGDDYFHYYSIVQIADYLDLVSCAEIISLTNTPPVVSALGDFTIPKSTAFVLRGTASDIDVGDVLTHAWEQIDDGVVTQATFGPTNPGGANFRSHRPSTSPSRYFPNLSRVLQGNLSQTDPTINSAWETVSEVEREMNFAFTVRDNGLGGGQVVSDLMKVTVVNSAGPFIVTSQATSGIFLAGSSQDIVWDVANTDKAPINSLEVDILLSIDGGLTFPIFLAQNVPNDGGHTILLPAAPTTNARIMVKASNNVFFAVNSSGFTIEESQVVLNFSELEYSICQPNDLLINFDYETYMGFAEETTFTIASAPPELGISFLPMITSVDVTVDMTITNTASLLEDTYQISVLATSASISRTVILDISIYDTSFPNVQLLSPADGFVNASTSVLLEWEEDSSYTSYDIEVATDMAFTSIAETATVISNVYTPFDLQHETTYYWRVKPKNSCGEGVFGTPLSFTTIQFNCDNRSAVGLPLAISPSGTPVIISKVAFFEDLALSDINVNLELDHDFLADLVVSLTSPSGTTVVLVSSSCGDLKNINATFDDSASSFVCDGNPAISGTVKPLGSLGSFEGESILGEWILQVSDNAPSDGGFLKSFSLDICIEGEFRPDDDNDGVFDDGDDLCLGTPEGAEVDASGCAVYRFPNNNFSVALQSESCRNKNDGAIIITPLLPLTYTISIQGNGVDITDNFTTAFTLGDLASGTYSICIGGTDGTFVYVEHCFEVIISEPPLLSVSSKVSTDGKQALLTLEGSDLYYIELNGERIQTQEQEITIFLKNGNNTLRVSTNLVCQGIYEEQFFFSDKPMVYPNPFVDFTTLFLGAYVNDITVEVYTINGQLIHIKKHQVNGKEMALDLTALPSGIYVIKYKALHLKGTAKIIIR
ncbi:MAG: zinc-dependent metalloprotease family protein [Flavobacteriaceae bacterium]